MTYVNVWGAACQVCDRKIGIVDEFVPWGDGVCHVRCWQPEDDEGDE